MKLYNKYKIKFSNNFDRYPEKANDNWTEVSANKAILNVLRAINHSNDKSFLVKLRFNILRIIKNFYEFF